MKAPVMRWIGRVAGAFLLLILALAAYIQFGGHSYFWTALRYTYLDGHNTAHIDDAANFEQAAVPSTIAKPWLQDERAAQTRIAPDLLRHLQAERSAAFLVIHQGKLLHETYFAPYTATSQTNSFSMAKTVVTMLTGAAIADGLIPSFETPLSNYLPEYANDPRGSKATLAQLSAMTSGHEWTEHYYLPLNPTTKLYFGGDVTGTVLAQGFERDPGTAFEYSSASTQVLALALQRALQARQPDLTLSSYLASRFWQPMGMEGDASWSLDRPRAEGGMEMGYCCIHSAARNFARLGQLLLQGGRWGDQQLLPAEFVQQMVRPNGFVSHYGHSLWMDPGYRTPFYFLQGHLGQYVIVVPSAQLVVVRLGQVRHRTYNQHKLIPDEVYRYVEGGLRMAQ
ncbi:serine hydrolase [Hydrogenophaga sp.]|uniref:serine hydrolase domain-containing protein n=1 Tax=Hydrogenophaga sp. TaxID=1904254 RepID=UPI0025BA0C62|nr:serine hydrolase [Hydrogenophaga sp.]